MTTHYQGLKSVELLNLRRQLANNRDLEGLFDLAKYRILKGGMGSNRETFPEICYYFGRLNKLDDFKNFMKSHPTIPFMLPESSLKLAQKLLEIGLNFPYLSHQDMAFLDQSYSDLSLFQLFDIIMFDADKLSRPIKKLDKKIFTIKPSGFSNQFLLDIYNKFELNDEIENDYDPLFVYSRIETRIISKEYEKIGIGEYYIKNDLQSNELYEVILSLFDNPLADSIAQDYITFQLANYSSDYSVNDFRNRNITIPNLNAIEKIFCKFNTNESDLKKLKIEIARKWLNKIYSKEIKIY